MGLAATEGSGQGIPCVYSLLASKKENIYEKLFSVIKEKVVPDVKLTILTDFEKSGFYAVSTVFPDAIQRGCWFHRNATIFAQVGAKGLQLLFYSNGKFQELVYTYCISAMHFALVLLTLPSASMRRSSFLPWNRGTILSQNGGSTMRKLKPLVCTLPIHGFRDVEGGPPCSLLNYGVSIMPLWRTSRRQTTPWSNSTEPGIVL